ncbi:GNAT family N-acetyltransferase [Streptomyces sp. NBS 14/10]|uniref:GNAT family N-acetyltransferase n=1 Tax=Streptomyces sp. NBS 14/10 TaxID=1945643 RepID=UPI000B7EBADB|nr:GNAT family N-acetyltransferase [Streptomyces sp. NBS 14/10]KAK1180672.1 GNAT family N-acetyltransferase [Streptomyces sp. NBS 14/10]
MTDRVELVWPTTLDDALRARTHRMVHAVSETGGAIGYLAPPSRAETDGWLDGVLADVRTGDAAFVLATSADGSGEVLGCALWRRRATVASYRHTAELQQVMTHPAARGRGIGRLLVSALIENVRTAGLELLLLGVRGNNHGAIALYEDLGFREWGRLPSGIAVGDERFDDVRMYLELGRPDGVAVHGSAAVGAGASARRA